MFQLSIPLASTNPIEWPTMTWPYVVAFLTFSFLATVRGQQVGTQAAETRRNSRRRNARRAAVTLRNLSPSSSTLLGVGSTPPVATLTVTPGTPGMAPCASIAPLTVLTTSVPMVSLPVEMRSLCSSSLAKTLIRVYTS